MTTHSPGRRLLDRATARAMLAAADAADLQLAQHRLVEDVDGRPAGIERTTEPMTFIPEPELDGQLGDRLQLAADAILTWALDGWRDYQARGLDAPPSRNQGHRRLPHLQRRHRPVPHRRVHH